MAQRAISALKISGRKSLLLAGIAAASFISASPAFAQAVQIDIDAQPLASALQEFSRESDRELLYSPDVTRGKRTSGVNCTCDPAEALTQLLRGTGLRFTTTSRNAFLIREAGTGGPDTTGRQDDENVVPQPEPVIIVTGTNIRGIAPDSSPNQSYDRAEIQASGAATAQDFIRTLPQNFGGGSNETLGQGLPNNSDSLQNSQVGTLGSSVNLRGLGSGSTLVLLNGHRVSPSSGIGDFVDISMIPASAIERVEVLTDGASSIYGADAVAGVVNFVLRRDFDGIEASYRYGTDGRGSLDEHRAAVAGGVSWQNGNLFTAYEYFHQSNLAAEDRSFSENTLIPNDLLPDQERHSFFAALNQQAGDNLELFADILFSDRSSERTSSLITGGVSFSSPSTQNFNVSAGGSWEFATDWFADFSGTYSGVDQDVVTTGQTLFLNEIEGDLWSGDLNITGPLFSLPGGEVRIATGAHYRVEDFENFNLRDGILDRQATRDAYAFYAEGFIPIFGAANATPGLERLELSLSLRHTDFSDFGSTTNPKVGILWAPIESLRIRGSYSTSFNPPPLGRVGANDLVGTALPTSLINSVFGFTAPDPSIADITWLAVQGTAKELEAETSRAFSAGFDFDTSWGNQRFNLSATYFDIEFENRLGATPMPDNRSSFEIVNLAFVSPELFPEGTVIFFPTPEQLADTLSQLDQASAFPGVNLSDVDVITFRNVIRNLSSTTVRGLDFDLGYQYDSDIGTFSLGFNGSYLIDFIEQAALTVEPVEQINTQFNPVDLRFRARAGYSHRGLSAFLFANYVNDYRVDNTPNSAEIGSWTTFDLTVSYDTEQRTRSPFLNNTVFRLIVSNIFDEEPPETPGFPSLGILGYDVTNASPRGRFLSFDLTKRF